MKFPLDPSSEEGREETELTRHPSVAQAKRSDRKGHDAGKSRCLPVSNDFPARGMTLAIAKTAGASRQINKALPNPIPPSIDTRIAKRFIYTQPRTAGAAPTPPRAAQFRYSET